MVKHLSKLLPKMNELLEPPILPKDNIDNLKMYCMNICNLIKNHKNQVDIAIQETVRLTERLVPFLLYKHEKGFQETVASTIHMICIAHFTEKEPNGVEELRNYVEEFGDIQVFNTTLNTELHKFTKLHPFLEK
jgi:hypothetical protein